ncbi:MAG: bacteriocin family protein [Chloroflexi bacterium]|nr:bacteriocin family protein [Chloroflexota bacterium]
MPDFLQRDQAPLTSEQWVVVDQTAVRAAQSVLIGRRIMSMVGPFGAGVEVLPIDIIGSGGLGQIDLLGEAEGEAVGIQERRFLPLPLVYTDFWVHWRDLEASTQLGTPLDLGKAAAAAASTAQAEDWLIFHGSPGLGISGLLNIDGRQVVPMSDWAAGGAAFADVVNAVRALTGQGFTGPYALVVSPQLYAELSRIFDNTGVLEIEQIEKLARRGVYSTGILPEPTALLVDSGAQNMDLAVGVDLAVGYVESSNLNHHFRVMESLVPRVRRPGAVCGFEVATNRRRSV